MAACRSAGGSGSAPSSSDRNDRGEDGRRGSAEPRQRLQRRIAHRGRVASRASSEATVSAAPPASPATMKVRREVIASMDGRAAVMRPATRARDARSGLVNLVPGIRLNNLIGRVRRIGASAKLAAGGNASGRRRRPPLLHHGCHDPARERTSRAGCTAARARTRAARCTPTGARPGARRRRSTGWAIWQARRLGATYADLAAQPRYTDADRVLPDRPLRRATSPAATPTSRASCR